MIQRILYDIIRSYDTTDTKDIIGSYRIQRIKGYK